MIDAHKEDDKESKMDSDLDALMDKYEEQDKKPVVSKETTKKTSLNQNGATASDIQDAELRILQGNNFATASSKTTEDDTFNDILDKFATASKKSKSDDDKILTKENAKDALTELYEKKLNDVDGYKA